MTLEDLDQLVDGAFDEIVDSRRHLHRYPELSFAEHATTAVIVERLAGLGLTPKPCPTDTGAVAMLEGGRPGRTVLVRADIDALPVQEETGLAFASETEGVMHACAHDGHAAVLLGVASILAARAEELPGRYAFVFQPAEELTGGAKAMVDGGVLDALDAERSIGMHLVALAPVGVVAVRPGIFMSEAQVLRFELRGAGAHGALATTKGNVVLAASELARSLGSAAEGLTYEGGHCACSAGVLHAGSAANVVPRTARVEGTLRTFTAGQRQEALGRLDDITGRVATEFDVEVELRLGLRVPAVDNASKPTAIVHAAATRWLGAEAVVHGPPVSPSDDVSEFLDRVPGCYFFVGAARPDGTGTMHHTSTFAIDEAALRLATTVLAAGAVDLAAH